MSHSLRRASSPTRKSSSLILGTRGVSSAMLSLAVLSLAVLSAGCSSKPEPQVAVVQAPPPVQEEEVPKWVPGPSVEDIHKAVRDKNADLRQCYLAGTFKNSQLEGTVTVLFTIDTEGKVSRASDAGSSIPDPDVVSCVIGVFGKLDFPHGGSSDTDFEYPVVFGRQHG